MMTSFDSVDTFQVAVKILRFGSEQPKEDFAGINIVQQQDAGSNPAGAQKE